MAIKKKVLVTARGAAKKQISLPSTVPYKDIGQKFSMRHDIKSFLDAVYANACSDCPIAEALVNQEYVVPDAPRGNDSDARKDYSRHYGKFKIEQDVKKIISLIYNGSCESYQRALDAKFDPVKWKLIKTVPELLTFIKYISELKTKERGSKPSVVAKARKAVSSVQQKDHEDAGMYVARGQRLWSDEKAVSAAHTPLDMVIQHLIDGLRNSYNPIIEHWQLEEINEGAHGTLGRLEIEWR